MIELVISSAIGRLTNLALINRIKFLDRENRYLKDVPKKIELINKQLKWIECFLEDAQSKERRGDQRAKLWVQEIRDVSYQIEDLIDTIELLQEQSHRRKASVNLFKRYGKIFLELSAIRKVGDGIDKLLSQINEISESRIMYEAKLTNHKEHEPSSVREDRLPARRLIHPLFDDDANIVGLQKDTERVVTILLDCENKRCNVISIVGMGGAGKTTLARKVYKTKIIQECFEISAWVIVSQKYLVLDLLKNILREIIRCIEHRTTQNPTGTESRIIEQLEILDRMEEIEVRERIIGFLKTRRFLIVLDDIWSMDTWEETNTVFPNTENGSRILLTTRNLEVAEHADRQTPPIQLELLNEDQSWELLEKRIILCNPNEKFRERDKLEIIGRKLVRKCGGLPLALVVLSGLLSKKVDYQCWLNLVDVLNQESATTMVRCTDILALSYHNLPNSYIKSCFLYIASFPADSLISTAKLIRLWISEGLVLDNAGCTTEETASCYLNNLIQVSLVQVGKRSEFGGHVKKIKMHDVLHDWCIKEAKSIGFLGIMKEHKKLTPSCASNTRRLVLLGTNFNNESISTLQNSRSLVGYNLTICLEGRQNSNLFNYIRVLHLEGSTIKMKGATMPHLRYLGLRNLNEPWLFSGCCFPRLESLDIKGPSGWFKNGTDVSTSLERLYLTEISQCPNQLIFFLEKQKNLHSLTIKMESEVHNIPFETFERFPTQLKTLKLSGGFESQNLHRSIKSLLNLTTIILQWSYLPEDPMPILEQLPNLELLKLEKYSYNGNSMSCTAGGFPQLKHLKLYGNYIGEGWRVEVGAMPSLADLIIEDCYFLDMLPEGLLNITSLKKISMSKVYEPLSGRLNCTGEDWHKIKHIPSISCCQ
ncbi:hypothetical protein LUZ63_003139 [Rhynchospora breviuscula]|uniref:Uncharacterized protein n=1 Tax=Rhynchospora breviuscula TaxID=2022672 RepID=A0A9Q0D045_9POAL|nr:hypothetical protein LUZ63_003139 [Rhynchospora breviuscula]